MAPSVDTVAVARVSLSVPVFVVVVVVKTFGCCSGANVEFATSEYSESRLRRHTSTTNDIGRERRTG